MLRDFFKVIAAIAADKRHTIHLQPYLASDDTVRSFIAKSLFCCDANAGFEQVDYKLPTSNAKEKPHYRIDSGVSLSVLGWLMGLEPQEPFCRPKSLSPLNFVHSSGLKIGGKVDDPSG